MIARARMLGHDTAAVRAMGVTDAFLIQILQRRLRELTEQWYLPPFTATSA